ncbi:hypothetical protein D3C75_1259170 [compost metagenome]
MQHHGIGIFVTIDARLGAADVGVQTDSQCGVGLGLLKSGTERDHAERLQSDAKRSVQ